MEKRVLILEDDVTTAEIYAKRLKDNGYIPYIAHDGFEGLLKLKEMRLQEIRPDLILLDLGMPNMNGIEFYQRICGPDDKPVYPVLVLTGRMDLEVLFTDLHVDGFLFKPFTQERLLIEMDSVLHHQHWRKIDGGTRRIVIIDDKAISAQKIKGALMTEGFKCDIAQSGKEGIEKIMANPPDLAVVSLGLEDLSGDLVILSLQQALKTKYISYILYIRKNYQHDKAIMENFAHKRGVKLMCEYVKPTEILEAAIASFEEQNEKV